MEILLHTSIMLARYLFLQFRTKKDLLSLSISGGNTCTAILVVFLANSIGHVRAINSGSFSLIYVWLVYCENAMTIRNLENFFSKKLSFLGSTHVILHYRFYLAPSKAEETFYNSNQYTYIHTYVYVYVYMCMYVCICITYVCNMYLFTHI